jgi:4,5-DOPA dioxygenase extradiol
MNDHMPAVFIGHGNPLNALEKNGYTEGWRALGGALPKPEGILAISAHWYVPFTAVTTNLQPPTIHDFGGFPKELYQVQYPAPGSPVLAGRVQNLLEPLMVKSDESWGLDHGTWSVLLHVYPEADIPVIQLSIDANRPAEFHYLPFLYILGLRRENDPVSYPAEGVDGGSISMLAVRIG